MRIFLDALSRLPTVSIGTQALIVGTMLIIKKKIPNVQFSLLSSFPEFDKRFLLKEGLEADIVARSHSQLGTVRDVLMMIAHADVIVSAWGDGYITTPPYKIINKTFFYGLANKPCLLFPSSIGPFKGGIKTSLARTGLCVFDRIMARDAITYDYLSAIGLKRVDLIPDSAFVLESIDADTVEAIFKEEKIPIRANCIGLNVSQLLNHLLRAQHSIDYIGLIVEFAEWLVARCQRPVILVPHQIYNKSISLYADEYVDGRDGDDRYAIEQVMKRINRRDLIYPVMGEYGCREMKGIIGKCEIFIGGRMHSVIAALSQNIPSILMQYSHKSIGLMNMLDMAEYVWECSSAVEGLYGKVEKVWSARAQIKAQMIPNMQAIRDMAWAAGDLCREMCCEK